MAVFQAIEPQVEVIGKSVALVLETMGLFDRMAKSILAKNGVVEIDENRWYPQQLYLDIFREIYEKVGPKTMKMIGKQVPQKVLWPPDVKTIQGGLLSIDKAYHLNHRRGEIGYYRFQATGTRAGQMTCYNPYPCPFDEGLIEAVALKFAQSGERVKMSHDPRGCRSKGDDACTYLLNW